MNLKEKLQGKKGFIFFVNGEDDVQLYYIGWYIFRKCNDQDIKLLYNKFLSAFNENDIQYKSLFYSLCSHGEAQIALDRNENFIVDIAKLLDSLSSKQIDELEEQINLLEKLYKSCVLEG